MAIEQAARDGKTLEVRASRKLSKDDYIRFIPDVENLIRQHGRIRVLFVMHDFHGWEVPALWEDIKFDVKHFADIEKVAMVGETRWQEWMATFCRPFTAAKIRYFDQDETEQAREWIASD